MGRSKGTGQVKKRGKYYYFVQVINGKEKAKSLRETSKRKAEIKAKELFEEGLKIKDKEDIRHFTAKSKNLIRQNNFTLKQTWDYFNKAFLANRNIAISTKNRYKFRLNLLLEWIKLNADEVKKPSDLTKSHVQDFIIHLHTLKLANKTLKDTINNLKKIFDTIKDKSGLNVNPFEGIVIDTPRATVQKKAITSQQLKAIFETIKNMSLQHKEEYSLLFLLSACTGARLKDCCLMQWDNINFSDKFISYLPYKTKKANNKPALVPLFSELNPELLKLNANKSSNYIFPNIAEKYQRHNKYVIQDTNRILTLAGIKNIKEEEDIKTGKLKPCLYGFHSIRYYFITLCAKHNIPIKMIMDAVGHSKELMNLYYQQFNNEDRQKAFSKLTTTQKVNSEENKTKSEIIKKLDLMNQSELSIILKQINTCLESNSIKK